MAIETDVQRFEAFLAAHQRIAVLTGAGVSVASGIPVYRDGAGNWQRSSPILHKDFLRDPAARQRYWARSLAGWPMVRDARPNPVHHALVDLERTGRLRGIITQNVDRLHQAAGSADVIDLHGRLDRVGCLDCQRMLSRDHIQLWLERHNPHLRGLSALPAPDGDADVPDAMVRATRTPQCTACGGVLMPDVVFFGGSVPGQRVAQCREWIATSDALLVLGSSLQVYSGFRFCRLALRENIPVCVVNPGSTRADDLDVLRLRQPCEPLLTRAMDVRARAG